MIITTKSFLLINRCLRLLCIVIFAICFNINHAYPPAPHFTIYGIVRDSLGYILDTEDAFILVKREGQEIIRLPIISFKEIDRNYLLQIPVDSGTIERLYKPSAIKPLVPFTIEVEADGVNFLPIEVEANSLVILQPGGSVRVDLTLGEDSDNDGLPDLWEQWQLSVAGIHGDFNDHADKLNADDDFDNDGVSNYNEYIAVLLHFLEMTNLG